jgi:plastocyanin
MEYHMIFYICGSVLAAAAVITSFIGLRAEKFPGRFTALVALAFVALVGVTTTYAVLNGQDESEARAEELAKAGEEIEAEEGLTEPAEAGGEEAETEEAGGEEEAPTEKPAGGAPTEKPEGGAPAKGPGGTLQLAASPTEIAFDTKELSSKPGKVTIDFTNPAPLEHDVAIEQNGKEIAKSETIAEGKTSVSADLAPGEYTFLCTVPGHAEAGMQGTLTVR